MDSGSKDPKVSEFLHPKVARTWEGLQGHLVKPLAYREMTFFKETHCS